MISRSIKISPGSPVLRSSFVNYGPVFPLEPWVLAISCNMARLSAMVAHFSSAWLTTAVAFALRGLGRWFLVLLVLGGFWHLHGQADVKKWIRTVCKLSAIGGSGQCCNIFWRCDDLNKRLGNSLDFASCYFEHYWYADRNNKQQAQTNITIHTSTIILDIPSQLTWY